MSQEYDGVGGGSTPTVSSVPSADLEAEVRELRKALEQSSQQHEQDRESLVSVASQQEDLLKRLGDTGFAVPFKNPSL